MADGFLFIYFGDDEAYFKALQGEFQQNLKAQIKFIRMYESEEKKIQHFYVEIVRKKPAVVFIDFSKQTLDYLHLARLVSRIKLEQKVVTVGLVDYLSPPQVLAESMATGVQFTFVKGPETFDVCFCISKLLLPNESNEHGFATADLNETWSVGAVSKVGYITESGLHVETNFPLSKGDQLKIVHFWQVKKRFPLEKLLFQMWVRPIFFIIMRVGPIWTLNLLMSSIHLLILSPPRSKRQFRKEKQMLFITKNNLKNGSMKISLNP
jgi:hypothetical protein